VTVVAAALLLRAGLHVAGEASAAYVLTPARFDSLALGGLLALLQRGEGGLMQYRRSLKFAVASGLTIILLISARIGHFDYESLLVGTLGFTALGVFFAGVVGLTMCAEVSGRRSRILKSRPLTFFGRYSYALYVVHPAVIFFWPAALSAIALDERLGLWSAGLFASSVMMLMVSVAISLISWHLLEKHFLGLRRYLPHERAAALAAERSVAGPESVQQSG
jgi:peptidoglycan/LPS O-acetylase OafA/YrhL